MKTKAFLTAILFLALSSLFPAADVVEEIYAVVNDEAITGSELLKFKADMLRSLQAELEGEKLEQALAELEKELLNKFIEQKLLLSKVKEKNYDVDADVETIIQEIKKQNNIASDDELKSALAREGIEFAAWKDMWRERRRQERLINEEVGAKIKIDNPQIMEYYRKNQAEFTLPAEFTLNCIYVKKGEQGAVPQEKMEQVLTELKPGGFVEVAKKYSELPGAEESVALGTFKAGELDKALEEAALKLKKDEYSGWIDTENGWYIIQLVEFSPQRVREVRDVREDISMTLRMAEQQARVKDYIEQLKKESYIKILKEYR
ncbi:MAG: peptidyl-prolyl cis-trans isomerase [Acidobacteria bacterium]|jgi:peptidyl-prolyl cis-trans isomerase SurA|nr:peptidyl-prolyl cis-trans isomerase [Acidobacteriota bacterium]